MELIPDRSRKNTHGFIRLCQLPRWFRTSGMSWSQELSITPITPRFLVVREMKPGIAWKKRRVKNRNCCVLCGAQDPHLTVPWCHWHWSRRGFTKQWMQWVGDLTAVGLDHWRSLCWAMLNYPKLIKQIHTSHTNITILYTILLYSTILWLFQSIP